MEDSARTHLQQRSLNMQERRKHRRIRAQLFIGFESVRQNAKVITLGFTRDISAGGMYIYTPADLPAGERVALMIHSSSDWAAGGAPPCLMGKGGVLRVERTKEDQAPAALNGIAIELTGALSVSC
jgi:hypothetical protein